MATFFEILSELESFNGSTDDLRKLLEKVSGKVDGATADSKYLLYSGKQPGTSLDVNLLTNDLSAAGAGYHVGNSDIGKLAGNHQFKQAMIRANKFDMNPDPDFVPDADQKKIINANINEFLNGKNAAGERVRVNSFWDIASRKYVEEATGSFRIILPSMPDDLSIFVQTELPALLSNRKITNVDGIQHAVLANLYATKDVNAVKRLIASNALTHYIYSGLTKGNYADWINATPESLNAAGKDPAKIAAMEKFLTDLDPASRQFFAEAGLEIRGMTKAPGVGRKFLKALGPAVVLFTGVLAATQASAATEAGNPEEGKRIMREWAVDAVTSEMGTLAATAIAGLGTAALVAAGVIGAPVAAALVLGAALVGGFYGAEAGKEIADLMQDLDDNGKMDLTDRMARLWYGETYTLSDPPPGDIFGRTFEMNAKLSKDDITELAKKDPAWRYALRELNSFVILDADYTQHNLDGSLNYFDEEKEPNGMTDEFIKDRVDMLWWRLQFDKKGARDDDDIFTPEDSKTYDEEWDSNTVKGNWDYVDRTKPLPGGGKFLTLQIDGVDITPYDHQIVFGSNRDDKPDTFKGDEDDDRMYGRGGDDNLSGLGGKDYLEGGAGNDVLDGGDGADRLVGGTGDDKLYGGDGHYADGLYGGAGNDELDGGDGGDALYGGTGNDKLVGGGGNDFLSGGGGTDNLDGGTDNDVLFANSGSGTITLNGGEHNDVLEATGKGSAMLDGGSGADVITGGAGGNIINGGSQNDLIYGGADIDIINGNEDADNINGGAGDDIIFGGKGADYMRGGEGNDTYNYTDGAFGTDLIFDAQGSDVLFMIDSDLGTASYDPKKMAFVTGSGYEIRQYKMGLMTMLGVNKEGDVTNTIYIHDWKAGQFGITLEGEEEEAERPESSPAAVTSRDDNNFVDFIINDDADGGQGNDIVRGSDVNSILAGGVGNDLLDGRGGDDWLEGGEGNDIILTGDGKDVAKGGAGNDVIRAGYRFDMVLGIYSNSSAPAVFYQGGAGADWWLKTDRNTGTQFYYYETVGGSLVKREIAHPELAVFDIKTELKEESNETYTGYMFWYNTGEASVNLEPSLTISLTLGDSEKVYRGAKLAAEDTPSANMGKGRTVGLELGNAKDVLKATTGEQGARLWGGAGNDIIYGGNESDKLFGEADNDLLVGFDGDDELSGGAGKDELSGGNGRDFLDGGDQADHLEGGLGSDVLYGGEGDDKLVGDASYLKDTNWFPAGMDEAKMGGDYIYGGIGSDMIWGNNGDDYLYGGAGSDKMFGGKDNDHVMGGLDTDTVMGGEGDDYVDGGDANDEVSGEEGDDILMGSDGDDNLDGGKNNDVLDGGKNNDVLTGGNGRDYLRGGEGDDTLYGDGGDKGDAEDILEGGKGKDTLDGGGKADMYVLNLGDGQDTLQDDGSDGSANIIVFKFARKDMKAVRRSGRDLVMEYGADDSLTVKNFYATDDTGTGYQGSGAEMINGGEAKARIDQVQFEDGIVWDVPTLLKMAPPPEPGELPPDPFAHMQSTYFINALLSRDETKAAGKHELTFSFVTMFTPDFSGPNVFTDAQKATVREALGRFSTLLDLKFVELANDQPADLSFQMDDLTSVSLGAFAGYATPHDGKIHLNSARYGKLITDEFGVTKPRDAMTPGTSGFVTLLHEIGHVLGLKHPFESPLLPRDENNSANTMMSYTHVGDVSSELPMFDVAALQYLYGVAKERRAGDNVYTFADRYIDDAAGVDTFDASAETRDVTVSLQGGQWLHSGAKDRSILGDGQAFIGFGVDIEHAKGGSGNDALKGSSGANTLEGGLGRDTLEGAGGDDMLSGGEGTDVYRFNPGSGADTIVETGNDAWIVINGVTVDTLYYHDGAIHIGTGGDRITVDLANVGMVIVGDDIYNGADVYTALGTIVSDDGDLTLGEAQLRARLLGDGSWRISGNALANVLHGNAGNNTLQGGAGNDTLVGAGGDDAAFGGEGNDLLTGEGGADYLDGGAGDDRFVLDAGKALIKDGAGRNTIKFQDNSIDLAAGTGLAVILTEAANGSAYAGSSNADVAGAAAGLSGTHTELDSAASSALVQGGLDASIEEVEDSHGNKLHWAQLVQRARASREQSVHAAINRRWFGSDNGDELAASQSGYTFVGGAGDDNIAATGGGNTFLFALGDGHDAISVADTGAGSAGNTLRFGPGISAADLSLALDGTFVIRVGGTGADSIRIDGFNGADAQAQHTIERFEFVDGAVLGWSELLSRGVNIEGGYDDDVIKGTDVADRIRGGYGDDTMAGGAAGDTYLYNHGDGNDWIREANSVVGEADVLKMQDVSPEDVQVFFGRDDVWLTYRSGRFASSTIMLKGQMKGDGNGIERVEFSNGTVWSARDLRQMAEPGAVDAMYIDGTDGDDLLSGRDGDDTAYALFGNDLLEGGHGNDILYGAYDYDQYFDDGSGAGEGFAAGGEEGGGEARVFADNDTIHGGSGNDTIDGGYRDDQDTLLGEAGDDTYVLRYGSGSDTVIESGDLNNSDSIRFEDLVPSDVRFSRTRQDLVIGLVGSNDSLTIKDFFVRPDAVVEIFDFDNGEQLTLDDILAALLEGGAGNDNIIGYASDDLLAGHAGQDTLDGGQGSDTYSFNAGDGSDQVFDSGAASDSDAISFGDGIAPGDVVVSRDEAGLVLFVRTTGEMISLTGWYEPAGPSIENVMFTDGTVWSAQTLTAMAAVVPQATDGNDFIGGTQGADALSGLGGNDVLFGLGGDDTLAGGSGNDLLVGGSGSDTYTYQLGDGSDSIADNGAQDADVLVMGEAIAPADVRVSRDQASLIIGVAGGGVITIDDWFLRAENRLAEVRFANATVWDAAKLEELAGTASEMDDYLVGSAGGDAIAGLGGNDALLGLAGNDTLTGGLGDDALDGGAGDDTYVFQAGHGRDRIADSGGLDRLLLGGGLMPGDMQVFKGEDDTVVLQRYGSAERIAIDARRQQSRLVPVIDEVVFADGTVWTADAIASYAITEPTAGQDNIEGSARAEILDGLGGNDSISGRAGNDRYIFKTGYGALSISDTDYTFGNVDTVELGEGIRPADVVVRRAGDSLMLDIGNAGDRISIWQYYNENNRIEQFQFADGTIWSAADIDLHQIVADATEGADAIYGSGRDDAIDALGGDDYVLGKDGNDRIDGGAGADRLYGGRGDDTLSGGLGTARDQEAEKEFDTYGVYGWSRGKSDLLDGGSGDDTYLIDAASGYDVIADESGNDRIVLGAGLSVEDLVITDGTSWNHPGKLRVDFGSGAIFLERNEGIERIESDDGKYILLGQFDDYRVRNVSGTEQAERIDAGAGPQDISSGGGDDTVLGGAGRDTINGQAGNDVLFGGSGSDMLSDSQGINQLFGDQGNDTLYGSGYLSGGSGNDRLNGSGVLDGGGGDDRLYVNEGGNVLFGAGAGHDQIEVGSDFWITLDAGIGQADVALVGGYQDGVASPLRLVLRSSGDTLQGIAGALGIVFADGSTWLADQFGQRMQAPAGNAAGEGDDMLFGGAGSDTIDGAGGQDTLAGGAGADTLFGNTGNDDVRGGDGDDLVGGGAGNDALDGGTGADLIEGGQGSDTLRGGAGNDVLDGGAGDDVLYDGEGVNTYRFGRGSGHDMVFEFGQLADAPIAIVALGEGIAVGDIAFVNSSESLRIVIADTGESFALMGWLSQRAPAAALVVRFADGTELGNDAILARVTGSLPGYGDFRDNVLISQPGQSTMPQSFKGFAGNDLIVGGEGRNYIDGGDGDDTVTGGGAIDWISGERGNDVLAGGGGDDQINGGYGDDVLDGNDGNDRLSEYEGNDLLRGGAGNDQLDGGIGRDTLDGGAGNDDLRSSDGGYNDDDPARLSDVILFGYGSGHDTLSADRHDRIVLGAGVTDGDLDVQVSNRAMVLTLKSSGETMTIVNWGNNQNRINTIVFDDGTHMSLSRRPAGPVVQTDERDYFNSSEFDDDVYALGGNDYVYGDGGNDRLHGGDGNDNLYGGYGTNLLDGGAGDDNYVVAGVDTLLFGFDSGNDRVSSSDGYTVPKAILFDSNVTPNDVTIIDINMYADGSGVFKVGLQGSSATLGWLKVARNARSGELVLGTDFIFGDGTVVAGADVLRTFYRGVATAQDDVLFGNLDGNTLNGQDGGDSIFGDAGDDLLHGAQGGDMLDGGAGSDTLVGGSGDDTLVGGAGRDVFRIDANAGTDTIELPDGLDIIEFAEGIQPDDVVLELRRNGWREDLVMRIAGSGTEVSIAEGWVTGHGERPSRMELAEVRFADGTVWSAADVASRVLAATQGANRMHGTTGRDRFDGLGGNDTIAGLGGDDILSGGEGNDQLDGGAGIDRLEGGAGNDVLMAGAGSDLLDGGMGDDTLSGGAGSDHYRFELGGGSDAIVDFGSAPSDSDTLEFGAGISLANVRREIVEGKLVLRIDGTADSVSIAGYDLPAVGIERIRFADGTVIDPRTWQVRDSALTVDTGSGMLSLAVGSKFDTLVFGAGITAGALAYARVGSDLVITSGADGVRLGGWFDDSIAQVVLQARFADGTVWSAGELTRNAFAIIGTEGDDVLAADNDFAASVAGNGGNDVLRGSHGADLLFGGDGNDTLDGGLGGDRLDGGAGDDLYLLGSAADVVVELAGGGSDTVRMLGVADLTVTGEIENYELTGSAAINMTGNAAGNRLVGTTGANRIDGGAGDDVLDGGAGMDVLVGGTGNDVLVVDNAADTLLENAGEGSDTVRASISYTLQPGSNLENITLTGEASLNATGDSQANVLVGNAGRNVLRAMAGDDRLDGGLLADVMYGGAGNDTYVVDSAGDQAIELAGEGGDKVFAAASFVLGSNVEDLALTGSAPIDGSGNALANSMTGNSGANILSGGAGDDVLDGGGGNDTLAGEDGNDVYYFGRGSGQDKVVDNAVSSGDTVQFGAGIRASDLILHWNGSDLVVSVSGSADRLTVKNFRSANGAVETFRFADNSAWDLARISGEADAFAANSDPFLDREAADVEIDVGAAFSLSVASVFGDADAGDVLVVAAKLGNGDPLPNWLTYDAATRQFSGTPGAGDAGTIDIALRASDSGNRELASSFSVAIRNPNDTSPVLANALQDQAARQDSAFAYQVAAGTFADADVGDKLTYSARLADGGALPRWLVFDAAKQAFAGMPGKDDVGNLDVMLTASDTRGRTASASFVLTIADINDAPRVAKVVADQVITQGEAIDIVIPAGMFADREGDAVTIGVTQANGKPLPGWLSFDPATMRLSGVSDANAAGITTVRVTGTDVHGLASFDEFDVVVANVNDAPVVANPIAPLSAIEGTPFSFKIPANLFADPDRGDTLSYQMQTVGRPDHAKSTIYYNSETRTLQFQNGGQFQYSSLDYWDAGTWTFKVTARDALGEATSHTFTLDVARAAVNHVPVVARNAAAPWNTYSTRWDDYTNMLTFNDERQRTIVDSMTGGFAMSLPAFTDVDGDPVKIDVRMAGGQGNPADWSYNATTNLMRFVGAGEAPRQQFFDVIATDPSGAQSMVKREVLANRAAQIGEIAEIVIYEGDAIDVTLPDSAFTDADGDPITVDGGSIYYYDRDANYAFGFASISYNSRKIAGYTNDYTVGTYQLLVHAYDQFRMGEQKYIKLTVLNTYDAPRLATALSDITVVEDEKLWVPTSQAFKEVDLDQVLRYSATLANGEALPSWLRIDPTYGALSGLPQSDDVGNYSIRVTATDLVGGNVSDQFDLNVQLGDRNHAPKLLLPVADQIYKRGQRFSFQVPANTFSDIDAGDSLRYAARQDNGNALPSWITFDAATITFSGVVPEGQRAPTEIRLVAIDESGAEKYDVFSIGIDEKTAPPVVSQPLADQAATEDQAFLYTLPANAFADAEPSGALALTASLANGAALPSWLRFDAATATFSGTPGNAQVGLLRVRVTATEADSGAVFDVFELTVANTNDAPEVTASNAQVARDASLALSAATLLAHASDIDPTGDVLSVSAAGAARNGSVALQADGSVIFTPDAGFTGEASFEYTVADGQGGFDTATVTVRVVVADRAPVALDSVLTLAEDSTAVLGSDSFRFSDADGGALVSVTVAAPDAGRLLLNGVPVATAVTVTRADLDAGKLGFAPAADGNGTAYATLAFSVDNGLASANQARLVMNVAAVNDAPVLLGDSASIDTGGVLSASGNVLANDRDVDAGSVLTVTNPGSYAGSYGRLQLGADGSYTYVLDSAAAQLLSDGARATDTFTYQAGDGTVSVGSTLVIGITGSNDVPLVTADLAQAAEDGAAEVVGNVLANDSDADAGTVLAVEAPGALAGAFGTLNLAADGSYRYVLDNASAAVQSLAAGQRVTERFGYAATDGIASAASTLDIVITGANDAPVTADDLASVKEDGPVTAIGNVLANDRDADQGAMLFVADAGIVKGLYGTLSLRADGSYSYALDNAMAAVQALSGGDTLADVFTYVASDGSTGTSGGLTIRIAGTSDAPVARDDAASAAEDQLQAVTGNVLANDTSGDPESVLQVADAGVRRGQYGTLTLHDNGGYSYALDNGVLQPLAAGTSVTERFAYTASNGAATAQAALDIVIAGTNDAPLTSLDVGAVTEDAALTSTGNVLANDRDADLGASLFVASAGIIKGRYGVLTMQADGNYSYALENNSPVVQALGALDVIEDVFTYMASDGHVASEGGLTIRIGGSSDAPVAHNDAAAVAEDQLQIATGNVLANDTGGDAGATLQVADAGVRKGQYGTLTLQGDGSYSYALDNASAAVQSLAADASATERFGYTASNGEASTSAMLDIVIAGANDAPVTVADGASVREEGPLTATGNVLANDSDADQGAVLVVANTGTIAGQYGTLSLQANGAYSYLLDNNSAAVQALRGSDVLDDVFTYVVSDAIARSTGSVTIRISGSSDAPIAQDDAAAVAATQTARAVGNVLANDQAADAGQALWVADAGVRHSQFGTLTLQDDGSYSYALDNGAAAVQALRGGETVIDAFSYAAADGVSTAGATLRVSITGYNDAPVLAKRLEDKTAGAGTQFSYQFELATFADVDSGDTLTYAATLADGKALPDWLRFDAGTRTFSGTVAAGSADLALGLRVTATDLSGASTRGEFVLSVQASSGAGLVIIGTPKDDVLVGTQWNDTIDGRAGHDVMSGAKGDDVYYVDGQCGAGLHHDNRKGNNGVGNGQDPAPPGHGGNINDGPGTSPGNPGNKGGKGGKGGKGNGKPGTWYEDDGERDGDTDCDSACSTDDVIEKANEGYDTVYSTASYAMAANVEALRLLGYGALEGKGNALDNALFGNLGANVLDGGAGNDILQGGAGADTLVDILGNNVLDGGAGDDILVGGAGREFIVGGAGYDWIVTGSGADVIAFNRGDGQDVVQASTGKDNTLSLGHGITYADLRFKKVNKDLILMTGGSDQVTFKDWYASTANRSIANLQVVIEGTADYNAASPNKLNNQKIEQFNFDGLVAQFDKARAANSRLSTWALSSSLLSFHLGGSDTAALGGDLAYQYAINDSLQNVSIASAHALLGSGDFGMAKQILRPAPPPPDALRALM